LAPINTWVRRSNIMERALGYAKFVLDIYDIKKGDGIIIKNVYGINSMIIDIPLEAKARGLKTIGVTSTSFADYIPKDHPARHPNGKNLYEIVDVFVDNYFPLGDAIVKFDNFDQKVAPTSTLCNSFTLNLMVIKTVEKILKKGGIPPVWVSANIPGGDKANKQLEEKYYSRVKYLR